MKCRHDKLASRVYRLDAAIGRLTGDGHIGEMEARKIVNQIWRDHAPIIPPCNPEPPHVSVRFRMDETAWCVWEKENTRIILPYSRSTLVTLLHECAHALTSFSAGHNVEFCRTYMALLFDYAQLPYSKLSTIFNREKVKYE